jgi:tRNA nucleotidyltransferase (CCA-adding enzyme)
MNDVGSLLDGLPAWARDLLHECAVAAEDRGETAYLVGGPVRDLLLGRPVEDIDVMVVGDGMAVAQAVARKLDGRLTRHHAFQTARVDLPAGHRLDVATARSETYRRPGDLPQVAGGTLEDDLGRRDFSINAMALELDGEPVLHDPFGGRADLREGKVRFLHERSFADDPTRMLRALRFAVRFGYDLEERTGRALSEGVLGDYLGSLTGDRLRRELAKLLEENPAGGAKALADTGLLRSIHPEMRFSEGLLASLGDQEDLRRCIGAHGEGTSEWPVTLAALATDLPMQERWRLARRLSLSRADRRPLIESGERWRETLERMRTAAERPSETAELLDDLDAAVVRLGLARAEAAGDAALAARMYRYLELGRWVRPDLTGEQLAEAGVPAGPAVGKVLRRLRAARLDGAAQDRADELRLVEHWMESGQIDPPIAP